MPCWPTGAQPFMFHVPSSLYYILLPVRELDPTGHFSGDKLSWKREWKRAVQKTTTTEMPSFAYNALSRLFSSSSSFFFFFFFCLFCFCDVFFIPLRVVVVDDCWNFTLLIIRAIFFLLYFDKKSIFCHCIHFIIDEINLKSYWHKFWQFLTF